MLCCSENKNLCRRTWISDSIGKFVAYLLLRPENAEAWMAATDDRRTAMIEQAGFKNKFLLGFCDTYWISELILGRIISIVSQLRNQ